MGGGSTLVAYGGGGAGMLHRTHRNEAGGSSDHLASLISSRPGRYPVASEMEVVRVGSPTSKRPFYPTLFENSEETVDDDGGDESGQPVEKKRRLSEEQVRSLEKNFEKENKLEPERKMQLARELGLLPRQVAVWFQNRRARWKTKQLEKDYESLKAEFDACKGECNALKEENKKLAAEVNRLRGGKVKENSTPESCKTTVQALPESPTTPSKAVAPTDMMSVVSSKAASHVAAQPAPIKSELLAISAEGMVCKDVQLSPTSVANFPSDSTARSPTSVASFPPDTSSLQEATNPATTSPSSVSSSGNISATSQSLNVESMQSEFDTSSFAKLLPLLSNPAVAEFVVEASSWDGPFTAPPPSCVPMDADHFCGSPLMLPCAEAHSDSAFSHHRPLKHPEDANCLPPHPDELSYIFSMDEQGSLPWWDWA